MAAVHSHKVAVAGDYPQLVELVPLDRVFVPDPAIVGVGVGNGLTGKHAVMDRRDHDTSRPQSTTWTGISSGEKSAPDSTHPQVGRISTAPRAWSRGGHLQAPSLAMSKETGRKLSQDG